MRSRVSLSLAALATFMLAIAVRLFPLSWSPYPTNLDGFVHARVARDIVTTGQLTFSGLRADQFVEPLALAIGSAVTGVAPVYLAQPLYSIVGAVTILIAIAFATRLGSGLKWSDLRLKTAATLVGITLAVEGIFVRRTGTPDSDAFTLVLIPLVTFGLYLYIRNGSRGSLGFTLPLLAIFPLTHTFSTLIGALTVTALFVAMAAAGGDRGRLGVAAIIISGFWVYFWGYYRVAPSLSLSVPYIGRVSAHPGLFLAWLIVMVMGVVWFRRTSDRARRLTFLLPLAFFFLVVLVNRWIEIFPGTVQTPFIILSMTLPLLIPVFIAGYAAPILANRDSVAVVLLALLAAPVVQILFSLTASLTPEFFATVLRAQTFAHLSAAIVAVAGVVTLHELVRKTTPSMETHRTVLTVGLVVLLLAPVIWSLPIAYIDLDTGAYPRGTVPVEFQAAEFTHTHVEGQWTSDQKQTSIAGHYFGSGGAVSPTASWLSGGVAPDCTLVSKRSWVTDGSHLFPTAPLTISAERYDRTLSKRHLVYHGTGRDFISITISGLGSSGTC